MIVCDCPGIVIEKDQGLVFFLFSFCFQLHILRLLCVCVMYTCNTNHTRRLESKGGYPRVLSGGVLSYG